nr:MAG TPA: hypothetical protein [Caudoviricetes sp.]
MLKQLKIHNKIKNENKPKRLVFVYTQTDFDVCYIVI